MIKLSQDDQYKILRDDIRELKSDSVHIRIIMDDINRQLKLIRTDLIDITKK